MKFLLWAVLALVSCAPPPAKRIDLEVTNATSDTLIVTAESGPFANRIVLEPGETWCGWIPTPRGQGMKAEVTIKKR